MLKKKEKLLFKNSLINLLILECMLKRFKILKILLISPLLILTSSVLKKSRIPYFYKTEKPINLFS